MIGQIQAIISFKYIFLLIPYILPLSSFDIIYDMTYDIRYIRYMI